MLESGRSPTFVATLAIVGAVLLLNRAKPPSLGLVIGITSASGLACISGLDIVNNPRQSVEFRIRGVPLPGCPSLDSTVRRNGPPPPLRLVPEFHVISAAALHCGPTQGGQNWRGRPPLCPRRNLNCRMPRTTRRCTR